MNPTRIATLALIVLAIPAGWYAPPLLVPIGIAHGALGLRAWAVKCGA